MCKPEDLPPPPQLTKVAAHNGLPLHVSQRPEFLLHYSFIWISKPPFPRFQAQGDVQRVTYTDVDAINVAPKTK